MGKKHTGPSCDVIGQQAESKGDRVTQISLTHSSPLHSLWSQATTKSFFVDSPILDMSINELHTTLASYVWLLSLSEFSQFIRIVARVGISWLCVNTSIYPVYGCICFLHS